MRARFSFDVELTLYTEWVGTTAEILMEMVFYSMTRWKIEDFPRYKFGKSLVGIKVNTPVRKYVTF